MPMGEEWEPSAERYHEIADALTHLARRTRYSEIRRDLLDLAERFEKMAERAGRQEDARR